MDLNNIDCPYCGMRHSSKAIYCENTGKQLRRACTNRLCSVYGKNELSFNAKYCPICGQPVQNELVQADKGTVNGHDYVDLGLSVKWATCNLGATKPYEFGNYYAWGEIAIKQDYNSESSRTIGMIIGEINGNAAFDPARAHWRGAWKTPTKEQMLELKDKCKWETAIRCDVKGMKVTGPNGNSIFLPGAGYFEGNKCKYIGYGYYFSATPFKSRYSKEDSTDQAWNLYFGVNGGVEVWGGFRELGYSIRPVME